mgnify:CR=1 FL=1
MATIRDVAKKAGVSVATVSRVFNGMPEVSAMARERILAAAESLNYKPHMAARNLRRRREGRGELTYTIGILQAYGHALANDLWSAELLASVANAIRDRGYGMRLITASPQGPLPLEIKEVMVDGVIMLGVWPQTSAIAGFMPVVTIDAFEPAANAYGLVPDYRTGVREMCLRLLAAGVRRIALTCGDASTGNNLAFAHQVAAGCREAYEAKGLPAEIVFPPMFNGRHLTAYTPAQGYEIGRYWLALPHGQMPEAVIGSDSALLGVYRAVAEAGLSIPNDISVIGTDGVALGEYYLPPLTTVDVNIAALGGRSVHIIADAAARRVQPHGLEMTPVRLVERASARLAPALREKGDSHV